MDRPVDEVADATRRNATAVFGPDPASTAVLTCDDPAPVGRRSLLRRVALTTVTPRLRSGWKRYSGDPHRPINADGEGDHDHRAAPASARPGPARDGATHAVSARRCPPHVAGRSSRRPRAARHTTPRRWLPVPDPHGLPFDRGAPRRRAPPSTSRSTPPTSSTSPRSRRSSRPRQRGPNRTTRPSWLPLPRDVDELPPLASMLEPDLDHAAVMAEIEALVAEARAAAATQPRRPPRPGPRRTTPPPGSRCRALRSSRRSPSCSRRVRRRARRPSAAPASCPRPGCWASPSSSC